jgi:hypothetical protein
MRSTTPTAVQPRHRNDSKLTAKRPPGHGPRPPRLGTRDRQPLLKIRPAQSPGVISRTATAARPHLGSGKDLQSRKEFKFGSGGGDGRTAETRVTASRQSRQSRPTHTRSEQPAMYVSPADNVTRHRARPGRSHPAPLIVARNATATLPRQRGRSRASGLRPSEITRQRSRRPPTIALHRNSQL